MAEVSNSASHGAVLSSKKSTHSGKDFDLRSWQGLTDVLKSAREANLSDSAYAEFRDLVLGYAQGRGDADTRARIDELMKNFNTTATKIPRSTHDETTNTEYRESPQSTPMPVDVPAKSNRSLEPSSGAQSKPSAFQRPSPSFMPKYLPTHDDAVSLEPIHDETPLPTHIERESLTVEPTLPSDLLPIEDTQKPSIPPTPILVRDSSEEQTHAVSDDMSSASKEIDGDKDTRDSKDSIEHVSPQKFIEDAPHTPHVSTTISDEESTQYHTLEENKARIAEIKHHVNARVGNPASLVGSGNQIGRSYMVALLSAMKSAGSGGQGLDSAMVILENAYRALIEMIELNNSAVKEMVSEPESGTDDVATPVTEVNTEEEKSASLVVSISNEPVIDIPREEVQDFSPNTIDVENIEHSKPAEGADADFLHTPDGHETTSVPVKSDVIQQETFVPRPPTNTREDDTEAMNAKEERSVFVPEPPSPIPVPPMDEILNSDNVSQNTVVDEAEVVPPTAPFTVPTQSVDATFVESHIHTDSNLGKSVSESFIEEPLKQKVPTTTSQAELASSEILTALNQLLHEWSLFTSSGIFGIGPGGLDHPLYKQLAPMSMAEVLGGRWEDSTPELRRTMRDYIDAWRHEQGIAYNPTETFDHYLKRVVQRILKRQKGENIA